MCAKKSDGNGDNGDNDVVTFREDGDEFEQALAVMVRDFTTAKYAADAMVASADDHRHQLIALIPQIRERALDRTVRVMWSNGTTYRLTIQGTGNQPRISKTKLLELGVSPDIIVQATEYSKKGETVVVAPVAVT